MVVFILYMCICNTACECVCVWCGRLTVVRGLQGSVVQLLVQLQVCVRVGVRALCVLRRQRCGGGGLGPRAPQGTHGRLGTL